MCCTCCECGHSCHGDVLSVVSRVHLIVSHGGADPAVVAADAGEDAGVSLHGAVVAPGNDPLQLTAAHQRAAGVPLQAQVDLSIIA